MQDKYLLAALAEQQIIRTLMNNGLREAFASSRSYLLHPAVEAASKDNLGDRMKDYEATESARLLDPLLPVYVRLDGRAFSTFTKGLPRPYDKKLSWIMAEVTKTLMQKMHCDIAYTQSDEISLGWFVGAENSQLLFGGRTQKLITVLAGFASAKFNQLCIDMGGEYEQRARRFMPHFDARVYQPPSSMELINSFVWREQDCKRNSVSMAAQAVFSHKVLQGKSSQQMRTMLEDESLPYERHPTFFRNGSYFHKVQRELPIPDSAPKEFNPTGTMLRTRVERIRKPTWTTTLEQLQFFAE